MTSGTAVLLGGRLVLLAAGGGLAAWSFMMLDAFWAQGLLREAGARIMAGDPLRPAIVDILSPEATAVLARPGAAPMLLRSAALVRVRQAEQEIEAGRPVAGNAAFADAETAVRAALAVMPTDSFLWFILAWIGKTRDGYRSEQAVPLAWSYRTGPLEGWVAVHRNAFAVSVLAALPAKLQAAALEEFRNLVVSNYMLNAADILRGPGRNQRDLLLAALAPLPETTRAAFARRMEALHVEGSVPGIVKQRDRPWR